MKDFHITEISKELIGKNINIEDCLNNLMTESKNRKLDSLENEWAFEMTRELLSDLLKIMKLNLKNN